MKVVWTFIIITFAISLLLTMSGAMTSNSFSTSGAIVGLFSGNIFENSSLWIILGAFIATMTFIAASNAVTGGNASVGITAGYAAFATYCLSLVGDYISVILNARTMANCTAFGIFACPDIGFNIILFFGVLLIVGFAFALIDLVGGND